MVCDKIQWIYSPPYSAILISALCWLHNAKWLYRNFAPENIIVVGGVAKLSGLEHAKKRATSDLEGLTRPDNVSLSTERNIRMVNPSW